MRPRGQAAARPATLALVSVNVGGVRSAAKLQQVLQWARTSEYHVIMLQEVGLAAHPLLDLKGAPGEGGSAVWPGSAFWSPGSAHSRGCLTLVKPHHAITHLDQAGAPAAAQDGRLLRVDCRVGGRPASLVNVYAPTEPGQRAAFVDAVRAVLPADRVLLLGGDLNCVLQPTDVVGGVEAQRSSRMRGADAWRALAADAGLVDIWRLRHPGRHDFTHWSASARSGARLDRWLVSAELAEAWGASSAILPGAPGFAADHLPVDLHLSPPGQMPRGAAVRPPFRRWMLDDRPFCAAVAAVLKAAGTAAGLAPAEGEAPPPAAPWPPMAAWLWAKRAIAKVCRRVARERRATAGVEARAAAEAAAAARAALVAAPAEGAAQAAWVAARLAFAQHWRERLARAARARSVLNHLYGESSTLFFHRHLEGPRAPTVISTLREEPPQAAAAEGQQPADLSTPAGLTAAMHIAERHFAGEERGLFRHRPSNPQAAHALRAAMPRRLSPSWAADCEGPLRNGTMTAGEMREALRQCAPGKAPGLDGLPYEFYSAFWAGVQPLLLAAVNQAFGATEDPQALAALLVGLIVLIHKGTGRPADLLVGYRPITLLNCDLKLLAKALANRLHLPLDALVDAVQSAFICSRNISDAVLFYVGLAEHRQRAGHPLWVVLSDLAQAYDSVSWDYLFATLRAMGFQEQGHVRWAQLLHRGGRAAVLVNGFATPFFPLKGGLAQGSGASPLYWTVVLQPFTAYVNSLAAAGRLRTPLLPGRPGTWHPPMAAPPVSHYADDTKAPSTDPDADGPVWRQAFDLLEDASGVPLSVPKTRLALLVGPGGQVAEPDAAGEAAAPGEAQRVHAPTGFRLTPLGEPQRLLGVPLCADPLKAAATAFQNSAGKLLGAAAKWAAVPLSLEGRAHVAKQCLASKLVFQASFLPAPPDQLEAAQRVLRRFVATGTATAEEAAQHQQPMPAEHVLALPKPLGGMGHAVLRHAADSLMAKHVAALFGPGWQLWKRLLRHELAGADDQAGLPTWAVTLGPAAPEARAPMLARLGPRVRAYVEAFAAVGPRRAPRPPAGQPAWAFFSVMAEPLFHNARVTLPAGRQGVTGSIPGRIET